MKIYNVIKKLPVGGNTAVIIDGTGEMFANGTGVIDENGTPFEVLSVGMSSLREFDLADRKTDLLIKGEFLADRLFV